MAAPQAPNPADCRERLTALLAFLPGEPAAALATELIAEFGSLGLLLAASREAIQRATDGNLQVAALIVALNEAIKHILRLELEDRPLLSSLEATLAYARAAQAYASVEQCRALFLTVKNHLIRDELVATGTIDGSPFYLRPIIKRALELNAAGIILIHNHPSGDPTPSRDDIRATAALARAASELEIKLHDHLIVARNGQTSFRALGYI